MNKLRLLATDQLQIKMLVLLKTINTTGLTLQNGSGGGLASNYTLSGGTHTYNVTQAPISFSGTRTYNATTNVEAANITLTGQQGGEDLTVTGAG